MQQQPPPPETGGEGETTMATAIYILYFVGFITGVTAFIAVVLAHVYRGEGAAWLQTHYTFQIRTFWIGLLVLIAGTILSLIYIGFLVYALWVVWTAVRCGRGLWLLRRREPIEDPQSYLFG